MPSKRKVHTKPVKHSKRKKSDELKSDRCESRAQLSYALRSKSGIDRSATTSSTPLKSKYFSEESDENDGEMSTIESMSKCGTSLAKTGDKSDEKSDCESESDESNDWEEVAEISSPPEVDLSDYRPDIPKEGVDILIDDPLLSKNSKKKKKFDVNDYIRQRFNKFRRDLQMNRHKTSLLLLMARGMYLNSSIGDDTVKALAISIVGNEFSPTNRQNKLSIKYLNEFYDWFKKIFLLTITEENENKNSVCDNVAKCLQQRVAHSVVDYVLAFISLFRALKPYFNVRLCCVFNTVSMTANDLILSDNQLKKKTKPKNVNKSTVETKSHKEVVKKQKSSESSKKSKGSNKHSNGKISPIVIDDTHTPLDYWAEIFTESEQRWICVDVVNDLIDKPLEMASNASKPLTYIMAFDSFEHIKEITPRYVTDWMSRDMKRRRVSQEWLSEALIPFKEDSKVNYEKLEDKEFESRLSTQPLPAKLSDYKNHPLYVLKRDLLKFEAIYPPDAPTLGFFRNQPVYARECVQTLRSRETWVRNGRVVKLGETCYKVVKSRPKWDKFAKELKRDLPLEVFGEWQTENYTPPMAKDGIVPRTAFGNVDLFQQSMLPGGTVHLRLPGLLRIASKLKIDCAPAIVGFDPTTRGARPVSDGFVVCEEFKDILIDAWNEEQENARQRDREQREKRVYGNWKRLIKGLLIREKLKKKYTREDRNDDNSGESDN